ncbi:MAG: hypothetical protein ABFS86_06115 [Planctomycetota bacterium]
MADATLKVYLWMPARKIRHESYGLLKSTMLMNAAARAVHGWFIGSGGHLSQGHAMIEVKLSGVKQLHFGKTTQARNSETEKLWAKAFLYDRTPDGGVEQMKLHASPARFQGRSILNKELADPEGDLRILKRKVPQAEGRRALEWINASDDELADDPLQRPAWGFDRGCTNWVHGALHAAGVFANADTGYRRVWVHENAWADEFDLDGSTAPWSGTQQGKYRHELRFLTPHVFRDLLVNRSFDRV